MADISEHHSEEKREGDTGEEGRIGFLIICHAIGLYDFLCGSSVVISGEACWIFFSLSGH